MFKEIMVPVDLEHADMLDRTIAIAADLASHYGAKATLVGVTMDAPTAVAHNAAEYAEKLSHYAAEKSAYHGVPISSRAEVSNDPTADLDDVLDQACHTLGADLVVMASHVPTFVDTLLGSNTSKLASHLSRSIMVVR